MKPRKFEEELNKWYQTYLDELKKGIELTDEEVKLLADTMMEQYKKNLCR